jgi:hypothetical protein
VPEVLASFRGRVSCQRAPGPLGLALAGVTAEHPQQRTTLEFAAPAPLEFPATLEDARVDELAAGRYRIARDGGDWLINARAVHLHREVASEFYRALPPRPVPPGKRLFWRLVLALAASRAGLSILRSLRR